MGVVIPQVVTEDRASEAQFIDGSLRFDASKSHYLTRTPSSAGNRNTWTWSGWVKKSLLDSGTYWSQFFSAGTSTDYSNIGGYVNSLDDIGYVQLNASSQTARVVSSALYRDTSAWYHIVVAYDLTQATAANRIKLYINGTQITALASTTYPTQNAGNSIINNNVAHYIDGRFATYWGSAQYSQFYFIDGQALDASYFGYTDPLTNTWRPKTYTGVYGTNGFYLPMDGNTPIGQDRSGNNNNWTPVNFGGSNTLEKATGALPILNTDGGGKVARVGVRTDTAIGVGATCVLAIPLVGIATDVSNLIDSRSINKTITNTSVSFGSTISNFYGGSAYFSGSGRLEIPANTSYGTASGNFTIECWAYLTANTFKQIACYNNDSNPYEGWYLDVQSTQLAFTQDAGPNQTTTTDPNAFPLNVWNHVSVVGDSGTVKLFVNGILKASSPQLAGSDYNLRNLVIGSRQSGTQNWAWTGYIQDFRIYKGVAKYTQNFIPASTDPDILPDTPSGVAYSSNVALVPSTDGSLSNRTSSRLEIGSSADFDFTGVDWTIETFFNNTSTSSVRMWYFGNNAQNIQWSGTNQLAYFNGTTLYTFGSLVLNTWYHLALVNQSGTVTAYINGVAQTTFPAGSTTTRTLTIGDFAGGTADNNWIGFISNFHIVKGTALYTSNFTPPTAPITSVANTKLLCCKSNSSVFSYDVTPTSGINNGTIWSQASTITYDGSPDTVYTTGRVSAMFDGSTSTGFGVNNGTTAKFISIVFPSAITLTTSLRVYATFRTGMQWKVNGSNVSTAGVSHPNVGWQTLSGWSAGTITSLRVDVPNGNAAEIYAIEIDGVILKDPISPFGNASASNFNPFTVNINTQRGQESGYATLDPLSKQANCTLSNGNLNWASNSTSSILAQSNITMSSGKWYCEFYPIGTNANGNMFGIQRVNGTVATNYVGGNADSWGYFGSNGNKYNNNTNSSYGSTYTAGDVIGVAFDADAGSLTFYKNGISQGVAYTGLTNGPYTFILGNGSATNNIPSAATNFGQKPFQFPPPAGFQPLALANTPRPSIVRPDQYVGIVTYTGNGSTLAVNTGFQPDLVWCKIRTPNAYNHTILDSVRGFTKSLSSSMTVQEYTEPTGPVAITRNGFTLNGDVTYVGSVNQNGSSYVAWAWKAGGNSNTYNINDVGYATASAAGLTAGTITPTGASVNTKSGFSIIRYNHTINSPRSIPHGLTQTPEFIIAKYLDGTTNWNVYHASATGPGGGPQTGRLILNATNSYSDEIDVWNDTAPTNQVWTVGGATWQGVGNHITYLWHSVPGFSKFGSYVGNLNTDGPTIICGFRPRWILIKRSTSDVSGGNWILKDAERSKFNPAQINLFPNLAIAETTEYDVDFLSNGFKIRSNNVDINNNGGTFIFAAFAETPSFNLYGGQANAR